MLRELRSEFRSGMRLDANLFVLTECIEIASADNRPLYVVFLDISGAYDNVNRELLWSILKDQGIAHEIIELVKEIYRGNTVDVQK